MPDNTHLLLALGACQDLSGLSRDELLDLFHGVVCSYVNTAWKYPAP